MFVLGVESELYWGHKFKVRAAHLRNKSLHTILKSRNAIVEAFHTQKVIKQRLSKQMVSSQERRSLEC